MVKILFGKKKKIQTTFHQEGTGEGEFKLYLFYQATITAPPSDNQTPSPSRLLIGKVKGKGNFNSIYNTRPQFLLHAPQSQAKPDAEDA